MGQPDRHAGDPKAPFAQMMMVALMMSMGVGNLALPQGVATAGLGAFFPMFVAVSGAMMWSMMAMLRAKGAIEERGIRVFTYQDLGYDLLGGTLGKRLVAKAHGGDESLDTVETAPNTEFSADATPYLEKFFGKTAADIKRSSPRPLHVPGSGLSEEPAEPEPAPQEAPSPVYEMPPAGEPAAPAGGIS